MLLFRNKRHNEFLLPKQGKKEVSILVEISHHLSHIHCGASTRSQRKKPLNVFNMSFPCCSVVMMMDLLQLELLVHTAKEKGKKNYF